MKKLLFMTMGSSLFESASWDRDAEPASNLPLYRTWLENPDYLDSPRLRASCPEVAGQLEEVIREDNALKWAGCLPADLRKGRPERGTAMRYSAEMATLIKLAEVEVDAGTARDLREVLSGYHRIYVIVDPEVYATDVEAAHGRAGERLSYIAGMHLRRYLAVILGEAEALGKIELLQVRGLASREPGRLLARDRKAGVLSLLDEIEKRRREHRPTRMDFVVTGGYKLYGMVLAQLAAFKETKCKLFYLYEKGDQLLQLTRAEISMGEEQVQHFAPEPPGLGGGS